MQGRAYSPSGRAAAALLVGVARGSMLVLLGLLLFFESPLSNPLRLIRWFTLLCLVPELAASLLARVFDVTLRIDDDALVIDQPRRRIEIPFDSIARIEPWALPLPDAGLWIRLKSGARFFYGLAPENPEALIAAVSGERSVDSGADTASGPGGIVRRALGRERRRWDHVLLKFPLFALVPALPLFRLHQWITYGGTFGEYYLYGLEAYLLAFLIYWANATIWLVLYAAGLRAVVTVGVLCFAFAVPSHAGAAGRAGDVVHGLLYYGGVAAFLVRLYLLSLV